MTESNIYVPGRFQQPAGPQNLPAPEQQQQKLSEEDLFLLQNRQFLNEVRVLANVLYIDLIRQGVKSRSYSDCCDTAAGTLREWDSWANKYIQQGFDAIAMKRQQKKLNQEPILKLAEPIIDAESTTVEAPAKAPAKKKKEKKDGPSNTD